MRVRVLGSAAGGGFPQWNCGCRQCAGVRAGTLRASRRTQESVAVTTGGERWMLLNASPDIGRQIENAPELHPRKLRDTPIAAVALTSGDVDHVLGLLCLREDQPLVVLATERVWSELSSNALFRTLARFDGHVRWIQLELGREVRVALGAGGHVLVTALPSPGKPPLHAADAAPHAEDNVALRIREPGGPRSLLYASGVAHASPEVDRASREADCVFFDGTFWSNDELVALGISRRTAQQMAHWPVEQSLAFLTSIPARRRIYIHVNNTNPIIDEDSRERRTVAEAGVEVASDGMEVTL